MILLRSSLALLAFTTLLPAALPLTAIRDYQSKAPEHLQLKVTRVEKKPVEHKGVHTFDFTVHATVTEVLRSAASLESGDKLVIRYSRPNQDKSPAAGDWPGGVKKGKHYIAYLSVQDVKKGSCKPAAYSGSFEPIDPKAGK